MDEFSRFHPTVNFLYFALVLTLSMAIMHPVCIAISLICSIGYAYYLNGARALKLFFLGALPILILTVILNPLFNHRGATILRYFPSGNPLTLESILYGVAAGGVFAGVILWFSCLSKVFTSDKFIYLFGRAIPGLSLIISMVLRFVPKFREQLKKVSAAQRGLGTSSHNSSSFMRIKLRICVLSIMITWVLEDGLDTAASMKNRGYGLDGRTSYTTYRFSPRDIWALSSLAVLGSFIIAAAAAGSLNFTFYPTMTASASALTYPAYATYAILCLIPIIINTKEDLAWKYSTLKS